ncbi:MAG: hypothetical protein V4539_23380 [Bacteroidota bacterium]
MKKIAFLSFCIVFSLAAMSQESPARVTPRSIFAKNDDVDFVLVSIQKVKTEFRYYLEKGKLHVKQGSAEYSIPLRDIDFDISYAGPDIAWRTDADAAAGNIAIAMKEGKTLTAIATPGGKEEREQNLFLAFPSREFAKEAFRYLLAKLIDENGQPEEETKTAEVMSEADKLLLYDINNDRTTSNGITEYLAELEKDQFKKYIGKELAPGVHESTLRFPLSEKALIRDADSSSIYKSARVLLSSFNGDLIKKHAQENGDAEAKYQIEKFDSTIVACLKGIGKGDFKKNDIADMPEKNRTHTTVYRHPVSGGGHSSLQLSLENYKKEGKIYYEIYLDFKREAN